MIIILAGVLTKGLERKVITGNLLDLLLQHKTSQKLYIFLLMQNLLWIQVLSISINTGQYYKGYSGVSIQILLGEFSARGKGFIIFCLHLNHLTPLPPKHWRLYHTLPITRLVLLCTLIGFVWMKTTSLRTGSWLGLGDSRV